MNIRQLIFASVGITILSACTAQTPTTNIPSQTSFSANINNSTQTVAAAQTQQPTLDTRFAAKQSDIQEKTFIFDPKLLAWAAYDAQGNLIKTGKASGGKSWCPDIGSSCRTKVGTFAVYQKGSAYCKSSKFPIRRNGRSGGAPTPYCMFFKGGFAIHASDDLPDRNASHGCVRTSLDDAAWLHKNFIDVGTKVIVKPYNNVSNVKYVES